MFNMKVVLAKNYFSLLINPRSFYRRVPVKAAPREYFLTPFFDGDIQLKGYFAPTEEELQFRASESLRCSISRTRKRIHEIAGCMDIAWFATFTIDPATGIDRYDYSECFSKVRSYLKELRSTIPNLQYIVIPERHKDGAYHFHGLFNSAVSPELIFAGSFALSKKSVFKTEVYHMSSWEYGFTSVIAVDTPARFINYVVKYISKDLCVATANKQRFLYSRHTIFTPVSACAIVKRSLLPLIRQRVEEITGRSFYESQYCWKLEMDYESLGTINDILDFLNSDAVCAIPEPIAPDIGKFRVPRILDT